MRIRSIFFDLNWLGCNYVSSRVDKQICLIDFPIWSYELLRNKYKTIIFTLRPGLISSVVISNPCPLIGQEKASRTSLLFRRIWYNVSFFGIDLGDCTWLYAVNQFFVIKGKVVPNLTYSRWNISQTGIQGYYSDKPVCRTSLQLT